MLIITEMTLEEEILEKCKIIEVSIIEVDRCNYRNDNFGRGRNRSRERQYLNNFRRDDWSSSSRPRLGLGQVLIEIELDVLSVGNMILLLMTVHTQKQKENQSK